MSREEKKLKIYNAIVCEGDKVHGFDFDASEVHGVLQYSEGHGDELKGWYVDWEDGLSTMVIDPDMLYKEESPL